MISGTATSGKRIDRHAAVYAGGVPAVLVLPDAALISPEAAAKYGTVGMLQVEYGLSRTPSKDELAAANRLLGHDDLVTIEKGYQSPARLFLIGILAAAQAWVLGQLGCVLGVGVGALYGYTAHAAFGSPHFVVPWLEIGGIRDRRTAVRRAPCLVDAVALADGEPDRLARDPRLLRVGNRVRRWCACDSPLTAGTPLVDDQAFTDLMGGRHRPTVAVGFESGCHGSIVM
ncbi:hypothetical protein EV652_108475 [Kribbella steppae]|uniref:Uncharacterized protein n=1 Tax=Kribbella steppae TaxID=2512223 RepID=A0A4R2HBG4_9ACTN|nr:hypothetical protein [Kribbella steppae]TCO24938.1 hypothetical protein EV652_108475 [Kribbella steppae]